VTTMATKAVEEDEGPWLVWNFSFCRGDLPYYHPIGTRCWMDGIPLGFQPRVGCRYCEKHKRHAWGDDVKLSDRRI